MSRWKVPRSFLEIAASQPTEWLNLKWGPKEFDFREAGASWPNRRAEPQKKKTRASFSGFLQARLEADAQQAAAHEAGLKSVEEWKQHEMPQAESHRTSQAKQARDGKLRRRRAEQFARLWDELFF